MTSDSASRVTRSRRALRLTFYGLVAGAGLATVLHAQEQPPATGDDTKPVPASPAAAPPADAASKPASGTGTPPAKAPGTGTAAAAPAGATAKAPDDDTQDENSPPPKGPSPNRFEPTEKVRADFDVSFPVDI